MTPEQELMQKILDTVCKLAVLRMNDTGEDENDLILSFRSSAVYGIGKATFSFEYNRPEQENEKDEDE